jgi:hypothetical protein
VIPSAFAVVGDPIRLAHARTLSTSSFFTSHDVGGGAAVEGSGCVPSRDVTLVTLPCVTFVTAAFEARHFLHAQRPLPLRGLLRVDGGQDRFGRHAKRLGHLDVDLHGLPHCLTAASVDQVLQSVVFSGNNLARVKLRQALTVQEAFLKLPFIPAGKRFSSPDGKPP